MPEKSNPITKITLKNFGNFLDRTVQLTPGLNVIRGPNRSGKTWILRGISAALANTGYWNDDPERDEIRHVDEDGEIAEYFSVELEFDDGLIVQRYRDANENAYRITTPDGAEVDYTAIGGGFFDPLGELTGIFPVSLDGKNDQIINTKLMTDPRFFLVGETERTQNRILTRLVGMDVVEAAEQDVSGDIRNVQSDIRDVESRKEEAEATAERYAPAEDAIGLAEKMEEMAAKHEDLSERAQNGRELFDDLEQVSADLKKATARIGVLKTKLPKLLSLTKDAKEQQGRANKGSKLIVRRDKAIALLRKSKAVTAALEPIEQAARIVEDCSEVFSKIDQARSLIDKLQQNLQRESEGEITADLLNTAVDELEETVEEWKRLADTAEKTRGLFESVKTGRKKVEDWEEKTAKLGKELKELWNQVDVCPLCERAI